MLSTSETTTLLCLFHHLDQAQGAMDELYREGIPPSSISVLGNREVRSAGPATLETLPVPAKDLARFQHGIEDGGVVIAVSAISHNVTTVESIFTKHAAVKVGEMLATEASVSVPPLLGVVGSDVPVIENAPQFGKRAVDRVGLKLHQLGVEAMVKQSPASPNYPIVIDRGTVNSPATDADMSANNRTIELLETTEEAVVLKRAYVVEEVVVGRRSSDHIEQIRDTVRRTEVQIEEVPASPETQELHPAETSTSMMHDTVTLNKGAAQTSGAFASIPSKAPAPLPTSPASEYRGEVVIPVVEERLEINRRTVDRGGVRIRRRIAENPVETTITLHEEHIIMARHTVDRPASEADLLLRGNCTIELTEMADLAVITKSAHVVEEIVVSKQVEARIEHITESLRRTKVEMERIPNTIAFTSQEES